MAEELSIENEADFVKKRLLSAILALAMTAACMTACGNSSSISDVKSSSTPDSSLSVPESTADSESKTESTADSESKADSKADTSSDSDSSTTEEKQEEKEMLIKVEHLTPSGELIYTQTREYVKNDKGKILNSKFTITGDPKKSKASIKESAAKYEYDDNYKHCKYYDDKNEMSSEWFYDDNGDIIKSISYRNGRVDKTYLYEYNNIGKKSKAVEYAGTEQDRSKVITTTYTYNDKRLIQKESIVAENNGTKLNSNVVYEYDANGNNTKIIKQYNVGTSMNSTDTFTYTYDDHNNCTKKIVETAAKGMNPSKTEYKYEYVYNGDSYEKTSFGLLPTNNQYLPGSKQTYLGNNLTEEIIYSPQESLKGNLVVMEIVKYTYGTV